MEKCSTSNTWENNYKVCLLDLPDSILECILEFLSPPEICRLATVCTFLRDKCRSEHLWGKILKKKWGSVMGNSARREWQKFVAWRRAGPYIRKGDRSKAREIMGPFKSDWPIIYSSDKQSRNIWQWDDDSFPNDSALHMCVSLETGLFWFPAQLYHEYNDGMVRNWHDAMLSYDFKTDTFRASYPLHRWNKWGANIGWDKVRAPVIDVSPFGVYASNCSNELRPGDHIEIQWRRSQIYPFDWWYALISHLDTCNSHWSPCHCRYNNMLIVEFIEYPIDSPWRRSVLSRNGKEQGNERTGFYGGIRKLQHQDEIARWKKEILALCFR